MIYGISMAKENIYYSELKDFKRTRIFLEMTLPNIVKYSNWTIITIFFCAFIYLFFAKYNVVVKSTGVIRPSVDISKSISPMNGVITKKCFQDGDYVHKGDILYIFENNTSQTEFDVYSQKLVNTENDLKDSQSILEFIENGTEPVITTNSIMVVKNTLQKLKLQYEQNKNNYEISKALSPLSVSSDELKQKELAMIEAKIAYENYLIEKKLEVTERIAAGKTSIDEIKMNLNKINYSLDNCFIKSPADGFVYQSKVITEGEYITAGQEILKIVPYESDKLKMIININPSDIAELKENMNVRISFPKYPYSEYSSVNGYISFIPKDTITLEDGSSYFAVETTLIDNNIISRRTKNEIPILPGMITNVKIITRTEPLYLYFYHELFMKR